MLGRHRIKTTGMPVRPASRDSRGGFRKLLYLLQPNPLAPGVPRLLTKSSTPSLQRRDAKQGSQENWFHFTRKTDLLDSPLRANRIFVIFADIWTVLYCVRDASEQVLVSRMVEKPCLRSVNVNSLYSMKLIAVDDRPFIQKGKIALL